MGHYDKYREQQAQQEQDDRRLMDQDYIYYNGFPSNVCMCTVSKISTDCDTHNTSYIEDDKKLFESFNTGAKKDTAGKARFDLIPPEAMKALAETYALGAKKYSDRNWEQGMPFSVALGALKRHLNEFELGHMINSADGNLEHMAHVMWWAVALITFIRRGRDDLNDLPAYKHAE